MAASDGAVAYLVIAVLLVMGTSAAMYWRYAQRPFTAVVALPVFFSWTLGLLSTAALPYDVVRSSDGSDQALESLWYGIYWSTWLLSWVINPLIGMALSSGAFNWREKLKLSVKLNLRFYVVALVVVLLAIIILLAQGALAAADLLPLLISLSNTYGLLLVCIMMGYGLYTIPFSMWRSADSAAELERAAVTAVGLEGVAFDTKHDCLDVICQLQRLDEVLVKMSNQGELPAAMSVMWALVPAELNPKLSATHSGAAQPSRSASSRSGASKTASAVTTPQEPPSIFARLLCGAGDDGDELPPNLDTMTEQQLLQVAVVVHRRLIRAAAAYTRAQGEWTALVHSAARHEEALQMRRSAVRPRQCLQLLRWGWIVYAAPITLRVLAVMTAAASVFVVLCELFLPLQPVVPHANFMGQMATGGADSSTGASALAAGVCLAYMSWAMYYTLFRLSAFGLELTPGGHTDGTTLLDQSGTLCRLQFALAFNYLNMAAFPWKTAFTNSLGKNVQLTELDKWLPLLLVVVIILCAANCLGRVMAWVGLQQPDLVLREAKQGGNAELQQQVQRGQQLLDRAKRKLLGRSSMPGSDTVGPDGGLIVSSPTAATDSRI